jgi:hypothetical protein
MLAEHFRSSQAHKNVGAVSKKVRAYSDYSVRPRRSEGAPLPES